MFIDLLGFELNNATLLSLQSLASIENYRDIFKSLLISYIIIIKHNKNGIK